MKKSFKKIASAVLGCVMAMSCMAPVTAFAAETSPVTIGDHNEGDNVDPNGMAPVKQVYPLGTQSYYKVDGDKVLYADRILDGYTAIPSAYLQGSSYNEGNVAYGAYADDAGEIHFVALDDCAETNGSYFWYHGTVDGATVSGEVDTATNEDPSMSTQFYINVENGIGDGEIPPEETVHPGMTDDGRVEYEITVSTKRTMNLRATVPMYVCMYGYRGTGEVITPTSDAYQIKNYSTIAKNSDVTIVDIVMLTHLTKIYDENHTDENIYSIAYDADTGTYTYWYTDPTLTADSGFNEADYDAYEVIADKNINASGENYVIYIDGLWTFKAAGVLDGDAIRETVTEIIPNHSLTEDFIVNGMNFGKQFAVGATGKGDNTVEGLAIKVDELEATPATWRVVPMSTQMSKQGELAMTIAPEKAIIDASAIDLADCSASLDITDKGWFLGAPTVTNGTVAEGDNTTLPLITDAKIAGSNVNDAGCTPVVKVTYTIIPVFDTTSDQANTVGGLTGNRAA